LNRVNRMADIGVGTADDELGFFIGVDAHAPGFAHAFPAEERGGKTYYQCRVVHKTKEGRDMHINSGMEGGANMVFDRLEEVARELEGELGLGA